MSNFAFTWHVWPGLIVLGLLALLAVYAWRNRSVPGALPFAFQISFTMPWVLGAGLQLAATDPNSWLFWTKFQTAWQIPSITAALCFALEYANLGRFLTRRTLTLLAAPPLIFLILYLTNDVHHWLWLSASPEAYVRMRLALPGEVFRAYGYLLSLLTPLVFVWLFIRSPLHRWPAALCVFGQLVVRVVYLLSVRSGRPFLAPASTILSLLLLSAIYALVLFRFRLFDLIPIARGTMLDQMREGMLILDIKHRIIDLNPAAEIILGLPAASARGEDLLRFLPMHSILVTASDDPRPAQAEIKLHVDGVGRDYLLRLSSLKNRRGFPLGQLVLFHDVTEQKRAEAQLLEQQRALATLNERVRTARELHDGLGQVLGYLKMQAQAARGLLTQGKPLEAEHALEHLIGVAQETHTDVREYIAGAKVGVNRDDFLNALRQYLVRFGENYHIRTELHVPGELADCVFSPAVEAQLLHMIQEALANVRKHAQTASAWVSLRLANDKVQIMIRDDGVGFDPTPSANDAGQHFGLRIMRERAVEVGGSIEVRSEPTRGTTVIIEVPLGREVHL